MSRSTAFALIRCPKIRANTAKKTCLNSWQTANSEDNPNNQHPCFGCERGSVVKKESDRRTKQNKRRRTYSKPHPNSPPTPPPPPKVEEKKPHLDHTFKCGKKKENVCFQDCINSYFKASAGNLIKLPQSLEKCRNCRIGATHRRKYSKSGFNGNFVEDY